MEDSIVDGPGLRTAIFAQGCPRRCEGCHNPQSHAFGTGTDWTVEDLFAHIRKNPIVRGVTFSGGEPFSQAAPFARLARMLKEAGYEVYVRGAGRQWFARAEGFARNAGYPHRRRIHPRAAQFGSALSRQR